MVVLLGIAFLAGVITARLAVRAARPPDRARRRRERRPRRPYAIVAGLVTMFVVSILFASYILDKLGLPAGSAAQPLDRAAVRRSRRRCSSRRSALLVERALAPLSRRGAERHRQRLPARLRARLRVRPLRRPILAYVSAQSASVNFGFRPSPSRSPTRSARRSCCSRSRSAASASRSRCAPASAAPHRARRRRRAPPRSRSSSTLDTKLQTSLPNWTNFLQEHTENTRSRATSSTSKRSAKPVQTAEPRPARLRPGAALAGGGRWFNSHAADDAEAARQGRPGRLLDVLVHQLPAHAAAARGVGHAYRKDGLVIVGVHTPEFAFEHVSSNVSRRDQAPRRPLSGRPGQRLRDLERVREPVLARGVPDRQQGHVRHAHFGEGEYDATEKLIRELLGVDRGKR